MLQSFSILLFAHHTCFDGNRYGDNKQSTQSEFVNLRLILPLFFSLHFLISIFSKIQSPFSGKRKYQQMMQETKALKQCQKQIETDTADTESENEQNHNNTETMSLSPSDRSSSKSKMSLSPPSPKVSHSKMDDVDIECNGLLLKSQKANFDELTYLMRGIEPQPISPKPTNTNNTNHREERKKAFLGQIGSVIKLGRWLQNEKNLLIARGVKFIGVILDRLRHLSRCYVHENVMMCSITAILLILYRQNVGDLNDVAVDILMRFLPNNTVSIEQIIESLKRCPSPTQKSTARRSRRRVRNQNNHRQSSNEKMARDLRHCFEGSNGADSTTNSMVHHTVGFMASFLLKEIAGHSMGSTLGLTLNSKSNEHEVDEQSVCREIMEYLSHSAVLYKLSNIIQNECVSMTECEELNETVERIENELILMEIITRTLEWNKGSKSEDRTVTDSQSVQSKKEGLLKMLDSIGIAMRFVESQITRNGTTEIDSDFNVERFMSLNLKILMNISNGRSVTLKPDTMSSLFFALGHFHKMDGVGNYPLISLILGVLINCCERNRSFRAQFNEYRVGGVPVIEFLIRSFIALKEETKRMEVDKESFDGESDDHCGQYVERKMVSFYIGLLIGFLLQNTSHFKEIATKMNGDLGPIQRSLAQYMVFQQKKEQNVHSKRTLTVISKIRQIVELRIKSLKRYQANVSVSKDPL